MLERRRHQTIDRLARWRAVRIQHVAALRLWHGLHEPVDRGCQRAAIVGELQRTQVHARSVVRGLLDRRQTLRADCIGAVANVWRHVGLIHHADQHRAAHGAHRSRINAYALCILLQLRTVSASSAATVALGQPSSPAIARHGAHLARREYLDKLSGLSRDISIKQAELEQENYKISVDAALRLEQALIDEHYKFEMLIFEAAKTAAEMSIAAINVKIEHFKALLAGYQAYAAAYETIIKAELAKVEVFKALLQAESVKAEVNKSLVDRYKAEIEGRMAVVEIYKARVGAAQTLVEMERTRIQASAEGVKAFVASVNAETAKIEMYKAEIEAEGAKQGVFGQKVQAYSVKVNAQAEQARANVAVFNGRIQAKSLEWDGWKAKLQAAVSTAEIKARYASIVVEGYKLGATAAEAQAGAVSRIWESNIKQYEASRSIAYKVAKYNADAVIHAADVKVDAAKIGLATGSQRVASAWAMVGASATVSDTTNLKIER